MLIVRSFFSGSANHDFIRGAILLFGFVLGCQTVWILTAEFSRPSSFELPATAQAAAAASANRNAAAWAASFGVIRGDLWAEYALTYLDILEHDPSRSVGASDDKTIEHAREVANRALALSPYDARVWLVLAGIKSRLRQKSGATLRMSYYTGANEAELIPLRLHLALNSQALAEKDFQELVRHDIRIIITRKPELKPAILTAYRDALPTGRQFLEQTLKESDPTLLATLRSKKF
jgi:hypothetical protein